MRPDKQKKTYRSIFRPRRIWHRLTEIIRRRLFYRDGLKIKRQPPITILANNCIAGFLYRDFDMEYQSPTAGLQLTPEDFVRFCRELNTYKDMSPEECPDPKHYEPDFKRLGGSKIDFPVGKLGDLTLYFQHYENIEEAIRKWNVRKKRIDTNRLFLVLVAYDTTPAETLLEFERLPWKNKVIITNNERPECPNAIPIHYGDHQWHNVINDHAFFKRKYYQRFDFSRWIMSQLQKDSE